MKNESGRRLSAPAAVVIAAILVLVSATGGAVAATMIDGSRLVNNSVSGAKIKNHTLKAADLAPIKWHTLTLQSPWAWWEGSFGPVPRYGKDALGFVHVEGVVQATASVNSNDYVAVLPAGFRPPHGVFVTLTALNGDASPHLVNAWVEPAGVIDLYGDSTADYFMVSLQGITFYAG